MLTARPCGYLKESRGFSPIVCDPVTGDLILNDDIVGNCIISEISVPDPVSTDAEYCQRVIKHFKCDGVVKTDSYLITIRDYVAEFRSYYDINNIAKTVAFDLNAEYDGEINIPLAEL